MSSFRDQPWGARFLQMGDLAEGKFEEWAKRNKVGYARYGLDRPPVAVHRLPKRVRYTPDWITSRAFVEVQGYGRDGLLKLKFEKHGSLRWWADLWPVYMYIYDSKNERETFVHLDSFDELLSDGAATLGVFAERKPYLAFDGDAVFSVGVERPALAEA